MKPMWRLINPPMKVKVDINKSGPLELSEDTSGTVPRTTYLHCWVHTWDNCFLGFALQTGQNSEQFKF